MFSRKNLIKLIIPLIIEQILVVTIGMSDTIMVSSVGEAAVSGVSMVDSINLLIINIFTALATGGAIVSSQYLGREDLKNASAAAKQLIKVVAIFSFLIMIVFVIGNRTLLVSLFGEADSDVMQNAVIYFSMSALSYPAIAIYNAGAALFRAMGNSKISMITSLFMNIINISGNAITIYGFKWGVFGAATASLIARTVSAVIVIYLLRNTNNKIHVKKLFNFEFNSIMIKNILSIGIPNGIENGMFQIGKILVQGLIVSFGTTAIAANAVANSICSMEIIPSTAIGLAMITVVGQCVGAGDYKQAKKYTISLTGVSWILFILTSVLMIIFINPLLSVFNLSKDTFRMSFELFICHALMGILFWPLAFSLPNSLRAANDVKFTMIVSVLSMWIVRILLSYYISRTMNLGVLGVWIAMTLDWVVRGIFFTIRFMRGKWKNKVAI